MIKEKEYKIEVSKKEKNTPISIKHISRNHHNEECFSISKTAEGQKDPKTTDDGPGTFNLKKRDQKIQGRNNTASNLKHSLSSGTNKISKNSSPNSGSQYSFSNITFTYFEDEEDKKVFSQEEINKLSTIIPKKFSQDNIDEIDDSEDQILSMLTTNHHRSIMKNKKILLEDYTGNLLNGDKILIDQKGILSINDVAYQDKPKGKKVIFGFKKDACDYLMNIEKAKTENEFFLYYNTETNKFYFHLVQPLKEINPCNIIAYKVPETIEIAKTSYFLIRKTIIKVKPLPEQ